MVSSGFDSSYADPLGSMMLGSDDYRRFTRKLCSKGFTLYKDQGQGQGQNQDEDEDKDDHELSYSNNYRKKYSNEKKENNEKHDIPIVFCHEGGYSADYVPFCGVAVIEELLGENGVPAVEPAASDSDNDKQTKAKNSNSSSSAGGSNPGPGRREIKKEKEKENNKEKEKEMSHFNSFRMNSGKEREVQTLRRVVDPYMDECREWGYQSLQINQKLILDTVASIHKIKAETPVKEYYNTTLDGRDVLRLSIKEFEEFKKTLTALVDSNPMMKKVFRHYCRKGPGKLTRGAIIMTSDCKNRVDIMKCMKIGMKNSKDDSSKKEKIKDYDTYIDVARDFFESCSKLISFYGRRTDLHLDLDSTGFIIHVEDGHSEPGDCDEHGQIKLIEMTTFLFKIFFKVTRLRYTHKHTENHKSSVKQAELNYISCYFNVSDTEASDTEASYTEDEEEAEEE